MNESTIGWSEENSEAFIDFGDIITPSRDEQLAIILSLIPAEQHDAFVAVDLACGAGSLSGAILGRFPAAHVIALDGSSTMLETTRERLADHVDRLELRPFDLRDTGWLDHVPRSVRCFVSSLAIHHLDDAEKQALYHRLVKRLEPGGAVLIVDIVDPVNDLAWSAYAGAWDRIVRDQSQEMSGNLEAYERFRDGWNHYADPDLEFDKPSKLFEQLEWLRNAGLSQVDCFWLRAGHAIYGGYRQRAS